MNQHFYRILLILFYLASLAGCAFSVHERFQAFEGPQKPKEEVGRVMIENLGLVSVDGIECKVESCEPDLQNNLDARLIVVELLPGTHTIELSYASKPIRKPLVINIQRGHLYYVSFFHYDDLSGRTEKFMVNESLPGESGFDKLNKLTEAVIPIPLK